MKRLSAVFAVSTALTTVGVTSALADPDFFAGLSIGPQLVWAKVFTVEGEGVDSYHLDGFASGAINITPEIGVQGDLLGRYDPVMGEDSDGLYTSIDGALHAFYRNPQSFLVGGFVQLGIDHGEGEPGVYAFPNVNRTLLGVEGQAFFDQVTVYGQAGVLRQSPAGWNENYDGWFVTGEIRYFVDPNLKLEIHAGRTQTTFARTSEISQFQTANVGLSAEYKFADAPFSVYGKYDYATSAMLAIPYVFDTHRAVVGLKFNLGTETLQDRDRNGASLKPAEFGTNADIVSYLSLIDDK